MGWSARKSAAPLPSFFTIMGAPSTFKVSFIAVSSGCGP
jgi:hypothetical protein